MSFLPDPHTPAMIPDPTPGGPAKRPDPPLDAEAGRSRNTLTVHYDPDLKCWVAELDGGIGMTGDTAISALSSLLVKAHFDGHEFDSEWRPE